MLENTNGNLVMNYNNEEENHEINNNEEEKQLISQNEEKTINEVYQALSNTDDKSKIVIKEKTNTCLLISMFYFIAPLFGTIFRFAFFNYFLKENIIWNY